jgi:hypothetical protein
VQRSVVAQSSSPSHWATKLSPGQDVASLRARHSYVGEPSVGQARQDSVGRQVALPQWTVPTQGVKQVPLQLAQASVPPPVQVHSSTLVGSPGQTRRPRSPSQTLPQPNHENASAHGSPGPPPAWHVPKKHHSSNAQVPQG